MAQRLNKTKYIVTKQELLEINNMYLKPSVGFSLIDDALTINTTYEIFNIDRESIYEVKVKDKSVVFYVKYGIKIEIEKEGD